MDRDQLAAKAHQLVSEAGILGFQELSELCRELEMTCRIEPPGPVCIGCQPQGRSKIASRVDTKPAPAARPRMRAPIMVRIASPGMTEPGGATHLGERLIGSLRGATIVAGRF